MSNSRIIAETERLILRRYIDEVKEILKYRISSEEFVAVECKKAIN